METVGRDKCPIRELGLLHPGEALTNGDWRSSVRERGRCWFGMKLECCHRQKAENRMPHNVSPLTTLVAGHGNRLLITFRLMRP